jgi:hypothetical protein
VVDNTGKYYGCLMEVSIDRLTSCVVENDGPAPAVTVLGPGRRGYATLGCWTDPTAWAEAKKQHRTTANSKAKGAERKEKQGGGGKTPTATVTVAPEPRTIVGCGFGYTTFDADSGRYAWGAMLCSARQPAPAPACAARSFSVDSALLRARRRHRRCSIVGAHEFNRTPGQQPTDIHTHIRFSLSFGFDWFVFFRGLVYFFFIPYTLPFVTQLLCIIFSVCLSVCRPLLLSAMQLRNPNGFL